MQHHRTSYKMLSYRAFSRFLLFFLDSFLTGIIAH